MSKEVSQAVRFDNLAQAREALHKLRASGAVKPSRGMSLHQVLLHCAQSIECSLDGFPQMKSKLIRATVGRFVAGRMLSRGFMNHKLDAPVPGAPLIAVDGDLEAAWNKLLAAIDRFEQYAGAPHEHFIFGRLNKDEFGRLHAMHIANHLSAF